MSDRLTSWLAKAVVQHDRQHSSNLQATRTGSPGWLVQITEFYNYRTPSDPRARIRGTVCDKAHHLEVEFDEDAIDRHERADPGIPSESLTSCKRALLAIKSYRWKLASPRPQRPVDDRLELPVIVMEILDFEMKEGNRHWPNLQETTVDIGRGERDGEVQKILRKWYFGESHSSQSQVDKSFEYSQPEAGPSRLSASSQPCNAGPSRLPADIIPLSAFLEPYISENGAKKGKTIPDWIFDMSDENRKALDQVTIFGLDFDDSPPTVTSPARPVNHPSVSRSPSPEIQEQPSSPALQVRVDKGKQKEQAGETSPRHASRSPSMTRYVTTPNDKAKQMDQASGTASRPDRSVLSGIATATASATQYATPPVPLGQRMLSTQTATQPILDSPGADADADVEDEAEESSDGEIPIRPRPRISNTQRRPIFDPLNFDLSQESVPQRPAQDPTPTRSKRDQVEDRAQDDGESTDSQQLSEYERSRRSKKIHKKRRVTEPAVPAARIPHEEPLGGARRQSTTAIAIESIGYSRDEPIVIDDESIPASESLESYSLSKQYPSPPKPDITHLEPRTEPEPEFEPLLASFSRPTAAAPQVTRAEIQRMSPVRVDSTAVTMQVITQGQDPDSLGSNKTGSGNTQSLPTPPPSDDPEEDHKPATRHPDTVEPVQQARAIAPSRPRTIERSVKRESASQAVPTAEITAHPVTVEPVQTRSAAPVRQQTVERSSHKTESNLRSMRTSVGGTPTRSALSTATARPRDLSRVGQGSVLDLDLEVDGLNEDSVQQYITRINAAREKQRSRAT